MKSKHEWWYWVFLGTGAVMLIAIGLFAWSLVQSSREGARVTAGESPRTGGGVAASTYEILARVYPPAYHASSPDSSCPGEYRDAMQFYSQRDFKTAIPALESVAAKNPRCVAARLYLGICELATNNRAAGITELRNVAAVGDTPYLEQARFYLAKGLLGAGDLAGAREQLNEAIALHGDLAQQAETLLARIK